MSSEQQRRNSFSQTSPFCSPFASPKQHEPDELDLIEQDMLQNESRKGAPLIHRRASNAMMTTCSQCSNFICSCAPSAGSRSRRGSFNAGRPETIQVPHAALDVRTLLDVPILTPFTVRHAETGMLLSFNLLNLSSMPCLTKYVTSMDDIDTKKQQHWMLTREGAIVSCVDPTIHLSCNGAEDDHLFVSRMPGTTWRVENGIIALKGNPSMVLQPTTHYEFAHVMLGKRDAEDAMQQWKCEF